MRFTISRTYAKRTYEDIVRFIQIKRITIGAKIPNMILKIEGWGQTKRDIFQVRKERI